MDVIELTSRVVLYLLMTVAVLYDFKETRVSNRLIVLGIVIAFVLRILGAGVGQIVWILPNIIFPVVILYLLYLAQILGAGDIKLFSLIGGFLNFRELIACICISFICAALAAFIKLIYTGKFKEKITRGLMYLGCIATGDLHPYETQEDGDILHFTLYELCGVTIIFAYEAIRKGG